MMPSIADYTSVVGEEVVDHLRQIAAPLKGMRVVHVNSTRVGGGVAEILVKLIPLMADLGLDVSWEVIEGSPRFYQCTKGFHNGLQGQPVNLSDSLLKAYEETNAATAEGFGRRLSDADLVFVHDPQPALLRHYTPNRRGKWVWRCHIDLSRPHRPVWKYLRSIVNQYNASIFSLADFAQPMDHPMYLVPPSIDPLSEKNIPLPQAELDEVRDRFGLDGGRPMVLQVSRFDRFKDPLGVLAAFRMAREFYPGMQCVLAGGGASDDPEGEAVLAEVHQAANGDPDIKVLLLPADAHRTINALQRVADIVVQKSLREGFGLTVTEAMWKSKPVLGGDTGGIRLQVVNHHTGFLVSTPEGAALRMRYLLNHPAILDQMGRKAHRFVRENFLLTRHLREYLTLMVAVAHGGQDRIVLG